ncbi:MAG: hypothetical protein IJO22_07190 [Oscillospiraceae bacterium]|nr:hypothetical protein [Oscillospiraceae bacterium]
MKNLKKASALFLSLIILFILPVTANASLMENDGLEVTIDTDRENYEEGEAITATITVTNTKDEPVQILNLEQLVPEGYVIEEGSDFEGEVTLGKGESISINVRYAGENPIPDENKVEDFLNNLIYGETWVIPNILLVIGGIAAVAIFFKLT